VYDSVFSGGIVVTKLGRFRLVNYGEHASVCCTRIPVHQISSRVLRFRAFTLSPPADQRVRVYTAKDSIRLRQPSGEPPA
jgi:hypothetical protein